MQISGHIIFYGKSKNYTRCCYRLNSGALRPARSRRDLAPVALPVARRATGAQSLRGWVRATGCEVVKAPNSKNKKIVARAHSTQEVF